MTKAFVCSVALGLALVCGEHAVLRGSPTMPAWRSFMRSLMRPATAWRVRSLPTARMSIQKAALPRVLPAVVRGSSARPPLLNHHRVGLGISWQPAAAWGIRSFSAVAARAYDGRDKPAGSPSDNPFPDVEMVEIAHPCTDWGFKRAFSNARVAAYFANALLGFQGDATLEEARLLSPDVYSDHPQGSNYTVDVLVRDGKNRYFLLEMQTEMQDLYLDRVRRIHGRFEGSLDKIYIDEAFTASEQASKRTSANLAKEINPTKGVKPEDFREHLCGIYTIVLSNQDTEPPQPQIINRYELRHTEHLERGLGKVPSQLICVALSRFTKRANELESDLDRFLFALMDPAYGKRGHHSKPHYKVVPKLASVMGQPGTFTASFYHEILKSDLSEEERKAFFQSQERYEAQWFLFEKEAAERGRAEGLKAGLEKGRRNADVRTFRKSVHHFQAQGHTEADALQKAREHFLTGGSFDAAQLRSLEASYRQETEPSPDET